MGTSMTTPAAILHLEDSALDGELIKDRLERSGLAVVIELVSDREAFTAKLTARGYDLILSDYQVPAFAGPDALALAREHQPDTPFIFVSGAMSEELAVETLKRGATDCVLKERLARLPAAVERALREARVRAEHRKAEERASAILERLTEAFVVLDADWQILYVNAAFEQMANVLRADILGRSYWEVYPASVGTPLEAEYRRVVAEGATAEFESYYAPCRRWFAIKAYPSEGGGICLQARDVTKAKHTAEELRLSGEWLKFALTAGRMGTWVLDLETSQLTCSDMCKANYGRGPADPFTYQDLAAAIHEDDRLRFRQAMQEAAAQAAEFEGEYRVRWPDGAVRWVYVRGSYASARGNSPTLSGVSFDVTDRKRTDQDLARLLAKEKRHTALLERVALISRTMNALLSADSIARILTEEACTLLGAHLSVTSFTAADSGSQKVQVISRAGKPGPLAPHPEPEFDPELTAAVCRDNRPVRLPAKQTGPVRWGRLVVPLIGHGGKTLGVVQLAAEPGAEFSPEDEAVLVQLAAIAAIGIENARLYELLRAQDRRKDEFLATLAHELRNPLAPVRNGLHILKISNDEDQRRQVREMMERQIGQMVRLIDDLMDLSRITRGRVELRKERVELRAVVNSALEASGPLIEAAGHALAVRVPGGLFLEADPTRMAQVIANLLNNSAKYTPQGGRITLAADTDGKTVVIQVTDTGVGIPTEMLPRVFDMFTQVGRTLDRAQGGLGIGLTLVRRLVEMHGGSVDVKSLGPGQGTTFTIKLPTARHEEFAPRPSNPRPLGRAAGQLRILVVDDDKDEAESLALLLRMGGYKTRTAHTGPEALAAARAFEADIVFLDIGLPGMDGYEVAGRLRSESGYGGAVLVALTGRGGEEDQLRSKAVGFDYHLTKPVTAELIKRLIEGLSAARG